MGIFRHAYAFLNLEYTNLTRLFSRFYLMIAKHLVPDSLIQTVMTISHRSLSKDIGYHYLDLHLFALGLKQPGRFGIRHSLGI